MYLSNLLYFCRMDSELYDLIALLASEHSSKWVELSRFIGWARGRLELDEDTVQYWLLDRIDERKIRTRLFLGRQYICINQN